MKQNRLTGGWQGLYPDFRRVGVYILSFDLRGFTAVTERESVATVERILDTLDALNHAVATEFSGTIRYSIGDSYCLTFPEASRAIAAAERLSVDWQVASSDGRFGCAIVTAQVARG
jgi:class 3 adenylate cyclase